MHIYFPEGKKVFADYKGFTIETDQPEVAGGEGSAPSSFDLFLVSLGTCAGFYVLSFCQQRNLATKHISLELQKEKNPQTKLIARITISIKLPPDFPKQYEAAVIKSASLCSVKKHLQHPPAIEIKTQKDE